MRTSLKSLPVFIFRSPELKNNDRDCDLRRRITNDKFYRIGKPPWCQPWTLGSPPVYQPPEGRIGSILVAPAPSPGWGREKLSEFMSETLWVGLASEDAASESRDSA